MRYQTFIIKPNLFKNYQTINYKTSLISKKHKNEVAYEQGVDNNISDILEYDEPANVCLLRT